jgi:hypothetical protein
MPNLYTRLTDTIFVPFYVCPGRTWVSIAGREVRPSELLHPVYTESFDLWNSLRRSGYHILLFALDSSPHHMADYPPEEERPS